MALTVGDSDYATIATSATVESPSINCSGSNRILIAFLMWRQYGLEAGYTSIKWGGSAGTALTQIGSTISEAARECHIAVAYLLNPAEGDYTLYGTCSQSMAMVKVGGVILYGADVSGTPLGTAGSATGETTTPTVSGISSAADEIVVDGFLSYDNTAATKDASQTLLWTNSTTHAGGMSYKAGAASTTMTWTLDEDVWCMIAVPVKPAGGGTPTLTQEGYRWRNDDGDQANATWAVAQDTGITAPANSVRRLRVLVDTSGDTNATQFQLEYKEANDANYTKVS